MTSEDLGTHKHKWVIYILESIHSSNLNLNHRLWFDFYLIPLFPLFINKKLVNMFQWTTVCHVCIFRATSSTSPLTTSPHAYNIPNQTIAFFHTSVLILFVPRKSWKHFLGVKKFSNTLKTSASGVVQSPLSGIRGFESWRKYARIVPCILFERKLVFF